MTRWLITNARLINEGTTSEVDVRIERGRIGRIDGELRARPREMVVDARGRYLSPGMIDTQVHFREPGLTRKGSIATESRAAVAGGITSFLDFPDTQPSTTHRAALADKFSRASGRAMANYSFYLGADGDNLETLQPLTRDETCGVTIGIDGRGSDPAVADAQRAAEIAASAGLPVTVHGEHRDLVEANLNRVLQGSGGNPPPSAHAEIHSAEAGREACRLAAEIAASGVARVQVAAISSNAELDELAAGAERGASVSAGVCLPHLYFMDADYDTLGNLLKCDPPIRSSRDRRALRCALADDRIDLIATGHAPHLLRDKPHAYQAAASGLPVVQFALPVAWSLVAARTLSREKLVEKLAHNPARRFGLADRGFVREDYWADLVLLDDQRRCEVDKQTQLSQCGWTPFASRKLPATVSATWVNGELVWRDGLLTGRVPGRKLEFEG